MSEDIFDRITAAGASAPSASEEPSVSISQTENDQTERTASTLRQCCQELMKFGLLEMTQKPKLYQTALSHQPQINRLLEPFDLHLRLDDVRGLAFLQVNPLLVDEAEDEQWAHPLVRRQRLTLEQSLLLAILRKHFLKHEQEAGVGGEAQVYVDELIPQLQVFLGELGSDRKEWERISKLLDKLKGHGLVSVIDEQDRITIRPIIAHLANPENLKALLQQYRRLAEEHRAGSA